MKKHLYWLIPILVILFAYTILFMKNLGEVTESPEEDWSRSLILSETSAIKHPLVKGTTEGAIVTVGYKEGTLAKHTYNDQLKLIKKKAFPNVPFEEWSQFYIEGDNLIYFDYYHIINESTGEEIAAANRFYPLETTILYSQENKLFQLDPASLESKLLIEFQDSFNELLPIETKHGVEFLTYNKFEDQLQIAAYQFIEGKVKQTFAHSFDFNFDEVIQDATFASNGKEINFLFTTSFKGSSGSKPTSIAYMLNKQELVLNEIEFSDPKGNGMLKEINSVNLDYQENQWKLLFSASGLSDSKFDGTTAFNIYEAQFTEDGVDVFRRSNTPSVSQEPKWLIEEIVTWEERNGEQIVQLLSSGKQEYINKADTINKSDLINAVGKTLGMATLSFLAFLIALFFTFGPLLFLVIIYFTKKEFLDRDINWIYYAGLGSYVISYILLKDYFFVDNIYRNAPNYLTFSGSSYVYFIIFALIAHLCAVIGSENKDWGMILKLFYFVGVHVSLLAAFFGPYIL
jgi:hypothetical protein